MNPISSDPSLQSIRCSVCPLNTNLKCCSRCRSVFYCSRDHQQFDWQRHRSSCQPLSSSSDNYHSATGADIMASSLKVQSIPVSPQPSDNNVSGLLTPIVASNSGQKPPNQPLNGSVGRNRNTDPLVAKDFVVSKLNSYCESIVRDLNEFGFCVIDDFLANGSDILTEVNTLYECGLFRAGQVVNNKVSNTHLIRGDHIVWVDGTEDMCTHIGFLVQTLDSIIMRCNTMQSEGQFAEYRIHRRTKAMIACYPGNDTKYVRHIDNPNNDGRCITSIYYLNKDYNRERDGGVLRLFPQISSCVADIEPKFNRVIFFWSDRRNPHEVMPSSRLRFAITVWYFDANERQKAIQRYKHERMQYPVDKDLRPF